MSELHVCKCVICSPPGPDNCQFESEAIQIVEQRAIEKVMVMRQKIESLESQLRAADELARVQRELVRTMDDDHWFADDIKNALAAYEKARGL
jgi:hypothetical protein